jgi:hypothetical protein
VRELRAELHDLGYSVVKREWLAGKLVETMRPMWLEAAE